MTAVVFATPAAMAEHGAAVRAAAKAVRRLFAGLAGAAGAAGAAGSAGAAGAAGAATTAGAASAAGARRRRLDHDEMARLRLVEQTLERVRRGAQAEAALGGPHPR